MTFGMMYVGLLGMRRRIVDYDPALHLDATHFVVTIAAFLIALSVLIFFFNFFNSIKNGEKPKGTFELLFTGVAGSFTDACPQL